MFKKSGVYVNIVLSLIAIVLVINTFNLPGHTYIKKAMATIGAITGDGTTNTLSRFVGASGTVNTIGSSIIYDDGTNIGIGTAVPVQKIHVQDTVDGEVGALVKNLSTGISAFASLVLVGDGNNFRIKNWGDASTTPNLTEFMSSATGAAFAFTGGNVGIGTTVPQAKLHINGTAMVTEDNKIGFRYSVGDPGPYQYITANFQSPMSFYNVYSSTQSNKVYSFYGWNSPTTVELVTILNSGNVGIGTTTPLAKLHVKGGRSYFEPVDGYALAKLGGGAYSYEYIDSSGNLTFTDTTGYVAGHQLMTIQQGGNVGIGTTAPGARLTAVSPASYSGSTLRLQTLVSPDSYYLDMYPTDAGAPGITWTFKQQNGIGVSYYPMTFSQGNVGIGVTSPSAIAASWRGLEIGGVGNGLFGNTAAGGGSLLAANYYPAATDKFTATGYASSIYMDPGNMTFRVSNASGVAGNNITWVNALYVQQGTGKVGIGTTSPPYKLTVDSSDVNIRLRSSSATRYRSDFSIGSGGLGINAYDDTGGVYLPTVFSNEFFKVMVGTGGNINGFYIKNDGNVGIGTTNPTRLLQLNLDSGVSGNALAIVNTGTGTLNDVLFYYNTSTLNGYIQTSSTATTYATTSDERLKSNITDTSSQLGIINSIKVRQFDWKSGAGHVDSGFIAQELYKVYPDAVAVGKDNADGSINTPWAVDYGRITPLLVKSTQELNLKIDTQQKQIDELKAEVEILKNK